MTNRCDCCFHETYCLDSQVRYENRFLRLPRELKLNENPLAITDQCRNYIVKAIPKISELITSENSHPFNLISNTLESFNHPLRPLAPLNLLDNPLVVSTLYHHPLAPAISPFILSANAIKSFTPPASGILYTPPASVL